MGINENLRNLCVRVFENVLRVPGIFLLEIWWIKRDMNISELADEAMRNTELPSYLEMNKIIEFVHTRNLDQSAATILSYSGRIPLFIS